MRGHSNRVSKDNARSETSLSGSSMRLRSLVSNPNDLSRTMASLHTSRDGIAAGALPGAVGAGAAVATEGELVGLADDAGLVGCVRFEATQTPATRISTFGWFFTED